MIHIFKTNKNNYLVVDSEVSLSCLPFGKEALQYLGKLDFSVTNLTNNPEESYEMGSGYGKYATYSTHLTAEQTRKAVENNVRKTQNRIKEIKESQKFIPELENKLEELANLEKSIA